MKKSILILVAFSFFGLEINAQLLNEGSGKIFRNAGGADRGGSTAGSSVFGAQGDWSVDLVVSEQTPATAANNFLGPTHNGMGATGWGSFAAGAYNRASGAGAVAIGFHNVAGPLNSDESSIPTSGNTTNLGQFAVGYGTQATGDVAFSAGRGTIASGNYSTAMGYGTTASGYYSTAMGFDTTASGDYSTAMGYNTSAIGFASTAMGFDTTASGGYSTAMGYRTSAYGANAIAMGNETETNGNNTVAMGFNTFAGGANSTAMGDSTSASGANSTTMGIETRSGDYASLVIGQYNSSGFSATDANNYSPSNTAFVIGNGINDSNRSDAFKVMFNGDATVSNDLTVSGDVNVSSDARLKANIASLGSTIAKLLLIDGKSYTMKKDGKQKIGVLAQDVQKVFPELVSKDDNEMLAVNYQGLVPVLINALKEQDEKISRLENLVEKLMSEK